MQYLTVAIITSVGWRVSWKYCGGFGMIVGIIILLGVKEPERFKQKEDQASDEIENTSKNANNFIKKATIMD
jgi:hypothetical protein